MRRPNATSKTKMQRREDAAEIAKERASRTNQQQLDILDLRLGKGIGAKKERARLLSLIEAEARPAREKVEKAPRPPRGKTRAKDRRDSQRKKKTTS